MRYQSAVTFAALWLASLLAAVSQAQEPLPGGRNPFQPQAETTESPKPKLKLDLPGELGFGGGFSGDAGEEATFSAGFKVDQGSGKGNVYVKAEISSGWHIYSLTQPPGGGQPSKLAVGKSKEFTVGIFSPDVQPAAHYSQDFQANVEEHTGTVIWTAPLELAANVKAEDLAIGIHYTGQVCDDVAGRCVPLDYRLTAKFDGYLEPQGTPGEYRPKTANLVWRGHVEPKVVAPGSKAKLVLTATPDEHWHLYPYAPIDDGKQIAKPTLVVLSNSAGWKKSAVAVSKEPTTGPALSPGDPAQRYYEGEVTFSIDLTVPKTAPLGEATLAGFLGFQTCDENSCKPPSGAKFSVPVMVAKEERPGNVPVVFEVAGYKRVAEIAAQQPITSDRVDPATLALQLGLSLIGGLLLNLMPCVLPVLGLKIMSFVQQGGQSRAKILELNAAYTFGLMSVFLALATLAAFLNLGWGEQMTQLWFRVTMLVLMFAFGLSFLGVWEMTVPGLSGSEVVQATQGREGVPGAFFKGIFTTILGVSCSGPFLGGVFGYTLTQPWWVTYLIFFCVGLGMASPFVAIGLYPRLISLLPKPGEWMNTFKHIMGFVMLGVAIYVFSTLGENYYIPALIFLLGVGFGLWWIGRVPVYEETSKQIRGWVVGTAVAVAFGIVAFGGPTIMGPWYPGPVPEIYKWEPYSEELIAKQQAAGKTVMLDFTADWCLNCQLNFRWALNRKKVKEVVDKNGIVAVKADWTDENEAIKRKLEEELGSKSIPVLAIYPAGKGPEDVIILRDLVTQQQVLEALQKAGPSDAGEPPPESSTTGEVAKVGE